MLDLLNHVVWLQLYWNAAITVLQVALGLLTVLLLGGLGLVELLRRWRAR